MLSHAPPHVSDAIAQAEKVLTLSRLLTPLNLAEEREKFFTSSSSNPQFQYHPFSQVEVQNARTSLIAVQEQLEAQEQEITTKNAPTHTLENYILKRKIAQHILEADLLLSLNTERLTKTSTALFQGTFSPEFRHAAQQDAQISESFTPLETLTAEEVVQAMLKYLQSEYNLTDWQVSVSYQGDFYVRVQAGKRQILINNRVNWDFTDLDGMLAHEIDGHVLRAINARLHPDPLLRRPLPFYIKTEEGLASYLGDYCSPHGKRIKKHHALKYLAGILAMSASFREVFTFLCDSGFTPELAFQRTMRLKRGLSDTSQPGCFVKEAIYYEGMLEVKKYFDDGGSAEKLFQGKVGLDDLPHLQTTTCVIPKRLTEFHLTTPAPPPSL